MELVFRMTHLINNYMIEALIKAKISPITVLRGISNMRVVLQVFRTLQEAKLYAVVSVADT